MRKFAILGLLTTACLLTSCGLFDDIEDEANGGGGHVSQDFYVSLIKHRIGYDAPTILKKDMGPIAMVENQKYQIALEIYNPSRFEVESIKINDITIPYHKNADEFLFNYCAFEMNVPATKGVYDYNIQQVNYIVDGYSKKFTDFQNVCHSYQIAVVNNSKPTVLGKTVTPGYNDVYFAYSVSDPHLSATNYKAIITNKMGFYKEESFGDLDANDATISGLSSDMEYNVKLTCDFTSNGDNSNIVLIDFNFKTKDILPIINLEATAEEINVSFANNNDVNITKTKLYEQNLNDFEQVKFEFNHDTYKLRCYDFAYIKYGILCVEGVSPIYGEFNKCINVEIKELVVPILNLTAEAIDYNTISASASYTNKAIGYTYNLKLALANEQGQILEVFEGYNHNFENLNENTKYIVTAILTYTPDFVSNPRNVTSIETVITPKIPTEYIKVTKATPTKNSILLDVLVKDVFVNSVHVTSIDGFNNFDKVITFTNSIKDQVEITGLKSNTTYQFDFEYRNLVTQEIEHAVFEYKTLPSNDPEIELTVVKADQNGIKLSMSFNGSYEFLSNLKIKIGSTTYTTLENEYLFDIRVIPGRRYTCYLDYDYEDIDGTIQHVSKTYIIDYKEEV